MSSVPVIKSDKSPREPQATKLEWLCGELPVRCGWNYTQADPCIIDKNDPIVDSSRPFDGISVERNFVEARITVEMVILPSKENGFAISNGTFWSSA